MPYCPNCKTEYDEGFHTCADCGAQLVETLPQEPTPEPVSYGNPMNRTFLVSTADSIQSSMLIDVLNQNGIPAFAQPKEGGGYLNACGGYSVFGEDIYVDAADLSAAKELADGLQPIAEDESAASPEEVEFEFEDDPAPRRSRGLLIMMWVAIPLILLAVIVAAAAGLFQ